MNLPVSFLTGLIEFRIAYVTHFHGSHYTAIGQHWYQAHLVFDRNPFHFGPLVFSDLFSFQRFITFCTLLNFSLRSESFAVK